jgi:cytochrome c biogenesis protein CcmG, thiol:disulfide interchange protein DsbE
VKHPARWVTIGVAVVVAALAVVLATQVSTDPRSDAAVSRLLGRSAPSFQLEDLSGQVVTTDSLAGKAVIVNFWNTWCIPCRQELPDLKAFSARHADDPDFALVGIVRDDTAAAVRAYVKAESVNWTIVLDPKSTAALAFGTRGQPETFAVSPSGRIVGSQIGPASAKNLETLLAAARAQ